MYGQEETMMKSQGCRYVNRRGFVQISALAGVAASMGAVLSACRLVGASEAAGGTAGEEVSFGGFVAGTEEFRGFTLDNVYRSPDGDDIHFSLYVPQAVQAGAAPNEGDEGEPYADPALYIALPGWEGLYFQGVGANMHEEFPYEAQRYVADMVIASPQLDDWGANSADQTVALTRFLMGYYGIDPGRVYISGYSGGGETLSLVLDRAPELYAAALHCSSRWDGGFDKVVAARTPVRFVIGEGDEYYGPSSDEDSYAELSARYADAGLSQDEIDDLVVLDIKDADYFEAYFSDGGQRYQHGAGAILFAQDEEVMGWLFSHVREDAD